MTPPSRVAEDGSGWAAARAALAASGTVTLCADAADWTVPEGAAGLPAADAVRYGRLAGALARHRFLVSRLLLRRAAEALLGIGPEGYDLARRPGGAPHLRGHARTGLNLSHTGGLVVLGVSERGRIGVDVERLGRPVDPAALADRICAAPELRELAGLPQERHAAVLLRLWTLKEAYTKALGTGLRLPARAAAFALGARTAVLVGRSGRPVPQEPWRFTTDVLPGGYVVSTATRDDRPAGLSAPRRRECPPRR
ncbi:4'-phosphopantetheinyl transferase superfamily protein [Streptomyces olivoreticuli]